MRKSINPLLLITLAIVLAVVVITPLKSFAKTYHLPGNLMHGHYGESCGCPIPIWVNCGCAITVPDE